MIFFKKLILASIFLTSFCSCNSSKPEERNYIYCNLKNFSMRIELSNDSAVYGETVWAKLIVRNNSDAKDSIAYFNRFEILKSPVQLISDRKDTTWICQNFNIRGIMMHYAKVPYEVFNSGEEKYYYAYFGRYDCGIDTSGIVYTHFIQPAHYKVSATFCSHCSSKEFVASKDTLNFTVTDGNREAVLDLLNDHQDRSKFSTVISIDSINVFYNEKILKYKNTVYESEFLLSKIEFNLNKDCNKCKEELIKEIEMFIEENPGSSQIYSMLYYYKFFRYYSMNDTLGTELYLTNLQKQYPESRISVWAKEYLNQKFF